MVARFLLAGALAVLLAGCTSKASHPPPPLNKQLLAGQWKSRADNALVLGYDFADDGTFRMTVWHMEQPVPGHYSWSGERDLDLDYQVTPEVKKAYEAAIKAYREKANQLPGMARPSALRPIRDELPAKETYRVGISEKPPLLILIRADDFSQDFVKAD